MSKNKRSHIRSTGLNYSLILNSSLGTAEPTNSRAIGAPLETDWPRASLALCFHSISASVIDEGSCGGHARSSPTGTKLPKYSYGSLRLRQEMPTSRDISPSLVLLLSVFALLLVRTHSFSRQIGQSSEIIYIDRKQFYCQARGKFYNNLNFNNLMK